MIFLDPAPLAKALAGHAAAKRDLEHHRWLMSLPGEPVTLTRPDGSTYRTSLRDFWGEINWVSY